VDVVDTVIVIALGNGHDNVGVVDTVIDHGSTSLVNIATIRCASGNIGGCTRCASGNIGGVSDRVHRWRF
jgi:hypothetical protein